MANKSIGRKTRRSGNKQKTALGIIALSAAGLITYILSTVPRREEPSEESAEGVTRSAGTVVPEPVIPDTEEADPSEVIRTTPKKRLMDLEVSYPRVDDSSIGNEWSYRFEINGEPLKKEYALAEGDVLDCCAQFTEEDDNPDTGEASVSYTVTADDIENGFEITTDLYVTENGGRNSGQTAQFQVTFAFSPQ